MNIFIPHHWLLEHLDTKATPKQIENALSLSGSSVESIEQVEGGPVYDIEVTTNRVDSMSIRGIAREAATSLPEFGIKAKLKPLTLEKSPRLNSLPKMSLKIINDPKLCHRLLGIKMSVTTKPSPQWLQKRLLQVDQRPLNNLIDATNYLMWELGHPTHVFDYDKFKKLKLIVREARKGEPVTTLDDKTYQAVGGEVVFGDGSGTIIDMPGLMGTKNTIVDDKTKNILFFIDSVKADKIRFASMTHSIRSQAAILNEKNVDPHLGDAALHRGIQLYKQIASAKITSQIFDDFPSKTKPKSISLLQSTIDNYMGLTLKPQRITRILQNLGCDVQVIPPSKTKKAKYEVTPPTWRAHDLQIPQDLIEEIARIYGYHNLPSKLMATPIPQVDSNFDGHAEHNLKQTLANLGLWEVYSYSMVSKDLALNSGFKLTGHIKIKNPLTDDWVYMRRSLIPSHQEIVNQNESRGVINIFELANVYIPKGKSQLPHEQLELVITTNQQFSYLKGVWDLLPQKLRLNGNISIDPSLKHPRLYPEFDPQKSGEIYVGNHNIGCIGHTSPNTVSLKLDALKLFSLSKPHPSYTKIPSTSPIIEDLTFKLPPKTYIGPVIDTLNHPKLVHSATLKSKYQQNYSFTIHYLNPKTQLTDKDVAPVRKKLIKEIQKTFSAKLIGKIH